MKTIEEKINYYKESLDLFDDGMDKYKFLIDQAKNAKNFPEEYRNESFKVSGCQAQVWLVPQLKENKLSFYYDSDAFISKGMVTILCDIYGDRNPSEIKNSDFNMLNTLELDTLLTPGRRNGVYSMLEKIKEYANSYV
jgi:cysteine desulfuration protein SufE|tara:strand:- start:636 stop:1049 length:414 start_codon:yes stop_codon:yes gene_type:complete